ncbi:hypothetical protein OGAPHI_004995 [Ogataea philodendri]|uniref:Uncharacterized protein n=1 Tax=Ogataea philodendri TaxID=1378263 RepID=A0A9P8P1Y2_9ASCO|nr:uncharacterized protein OGAPHI_004995 [Ogataea philodendri]KAH3663594.1 hypothetical protein OGAPHI_004995 [Ogataea philodendri]
MSLEEANSDPKEERKLDVSLPLSSSRTSLKRDDEVPNTNPVLSKPPIQVSLTGLPLLTLVPIYSRSVNEYRVGSQEPISKGLISKTVEFSEMISVPGVLPSIREKLVRQSSSPRIRKSDVITGIFLGFNVVTDGTPVPKGVEQSAAGENGILKVPNRIVLAVLVQNVLDRGPVVESQRGKEPRTTRQTGDVRNRRENRHTMVVAAVAYTWGAENRGVCFTLLTQSVEEVVSIKVCEVGELQEPPKVGVCDVVTFLDPICFVVAQTGSSTNKTVSGVCVVIRFIQVRRALDLSRGIRVCWRPGVGHGQQEEQSETHKQKFIALIYKFRIPSHQPKADRN